MHEVAIFERRGRLRLGAVQGGGAKNVGLVDERGAAIKVPRDRLLERLRATVPPADPRALGARLRALRAELAARRPPPDLELLWSCLEDGRGYALDEVASLVYGAAGDEELAALVTALVADEEGRLQPAFRLARGRLERVDAVTRARLLERAAREEQERREHAAAIAWLAEAGPGATPSADVAPQLEALRRYALAGERAHDAKATRRLTRKLGLATPDALLADLERRGLVPRDVNELPARAGLPVEFGAEARREAEALLAAAPAPEGEDLRHLPTVAVDDPSTFEVDDALSAWEQDGALHVGIHICRLDLVPIGGALDREALRRGTSVYFPGETVPMFPAPLVRGLLGLEAGQDRRALSLVGRIEGDALLEARFVRSVVRVERQLDYADGAAADPIARLDPFARALREARRARGATVYSLPHLKVDLDAAGEPRPARVETDALAHAVVSELMILYNAKLGEELARAGAPAYYRTQPLDPVPRDAPQLDPYDPLYPLQVRRILRPTVVATEPGPQRSMGLEHYVQATSPLRRMADLIAQRQLLALLDGRPLPYDHAALAALLPDLEAAARRARTLEEDRRRYFVCRWLAGVGELPAIVSRRRPMLYVPELDRELPCAPPLQGGTPPVGTAVRARVRKVEPRQREVLLAIVEEQRGEEAANPG